MHVMNEKGDDRVKDNFSVNFLIFLWKIKISMEDDCDQKNLLFDRRKLDNCVGRVFVDSVWDKSPESRLIVCCD